MEIRLSRRLGLARGRREAKGERGRGRAGGSGAELGGREVR